METQKNLISRPFFHFSNSKHNRVVLIFIQGSLKSSSSRRRPVSVDYELNSNSWENEFDNNPVAADNGFQMSGASTGGGGVLKDTTNSRSSHYSNRNSHPLTEREMEQGLQNIEGQKGIDMKKYI